MLPSPGRTMSHSQGHVMEGGGERGFLGGFPEGSLLNSFPNTDQNQLLEMLHVPLLHGGVREVLLLAPFTTTTPASFALACCVLVILTAILELLKLLLWWVEGRYITVEGKPAPRLVCDCKHCTSLAISSDRRGYDAIQHPYHHHQPDSIPSADSTTSLTTPTTTILSTALRRMCLACAGMLHLLIYLLSTLLMLVAMTMNVYLILSMGVGGALGKLLALLLKKRHLEAQCN